MKNRTTIVIDPVIHEKAKKLAKCLNMTLADFIGTLINDGVGVLTDKVRDIIRIEVKNEFISKLTEL